MCAACNFVHFPEHFLELRVGFRCFGVAKFFISGDSNFFTGNHTIGEFTQLFFEAEKRCVFFEQVFFHDKLIP